MNDCTCIEINTKESLISHLTGYDSGWIFRGQSNADWELQPTLERILSRGDWNPDVAKSFEEFTLHFFSSKAHHYIAKDQLPTTKLGWLSLMQHHGVPTRLLDFTEAPFIALFFAFNENFLTTGHRTIWALNYRNLTRSSINYLTQKDKDFSYEYSSAQMRPDEFFDKYLDSGTNDILWTTESRISNLRIERQKGTFLMSGNIKKRITSLIPLTLSNIDIYKILIQSSLVNDVYKILKNIGIDSSRLFSNLDGLARDIKSEMIYQMSCRQL